MCFHHENRGSRDVHTQALPLGSVERTTMPHRPTHANVRGQAAHGAPVNPEVAALHSPKAAARQRTRTPETRRSGAPVDSAVHPKAGAKHGQRAFAAVPPAVPPEGGVRTTPDADADTSPARTPQGLRGASRHPIGFPRAEAEERPGERRSDVCRRAAPRAKPARLRELSPRRSGRNRPLGSWPGPNGPRLGGSKQSSKAYVPPKWHGRRAWVRTGRLHREPQSARLRCSVVDRLEPVRRRSDGP